MSMRLQSKTEGFQREGNKSSDQDCLYKKKAAIIIIKSQHKIYKAKVQSLRVKFFHSKIFPK